MEMVVIPRKGRQPLEFFGELLAAHETSPDPDNPNFSGSIGYWKSTRVYRVADNCYVLVKMRHTMWRSERDASLGVVFFGNLDDLVQGLEEISPCTARAIAEDLWEYENT